MDLYLLFCNEGKDGVTGESRDAEPAEGVAAPGYEHLQHSIQMLRLAPLAPFLNVYLLPAVRPGDRPAPSLADPGDNSEDLLKRKVPKD